jgi:hypothetical protein
MLIDYFLQARNILLLNKQFPSMVFHGDSDILCSPHNASNRVHRSTEANDLGEGGLLSCPLNFSRYLTGEAKKTLLRGGPEWGLKHT